MYSINEWMHHNVFFMNVLFIFWSVTRIREKNYLLFSLCNQSSSTVGFASEWLLFNTS
jgi:hypothetical protein